MKGALLWKRILNEGLKYWPPQLFPDRPRDQESEREIVTSPIIVIGDAPPLDSTWYDLRGIAMPFPKFWIEGSSSIDSRSIKWGCLFRSTAIDDGFDVQAVCCQSMEGDAVDRLSEIAFQLDRNGNPIQNTFLVEIPDGLVALCDGNEEAAKSGISFPALSGCLALMVLGCKNVSLKPSEIDKEQVRRAVKRHGGSPESYRYHTLVVRPAGAKHDSPGIDIGTMPRHVCRGHFAEYGPEFGKGLLFGKYAGRFFIPPCLKGDKKNGVVEKDYAIDANSQFTNQLEVL